MQGGKLTGRVYETIGAGGVARTGKAVAESGQTHGFAPRGAGQAYDAAGSPEGRSGSELDFFELLTDTEFTDQGLTSKERFQGEVGAPLRRPLNLPTGLAVGLGL